MNLRCLLVDDEHFALSLLEKFIADTPGLEVVAACKSPIRAVENPAKRTHRPVVSGYSDAHFEWHQFVAHDFPKTGDDIYHRIPTTRSGGIRTECCGLSAQTILIRPFYAGRRKSMCLAPAGTKQCAARQTEGYLSVKADRKWVKIAIADIRYIEGWKEYVKIFTDHEGGHA